MRCQLTSLLTTLLVFSLMLLSSAQSFKITAKSYDHNVLGTAVRQLVSLATSDSFTIEGPTALPTKKFTEKGVEYRVYGQTLTISGSADPSGLIQKAHVPAGVDVEIKAA